MNADALHGLLAMDLTLTIATISSAAGGLEVNPEHLDFTLSRLKKGGPAKCLEPGNWAYLDSIGRLHKIGKLGYYLGCVRWESVCHYKHQIWGDSWAAGVWATSKKHAITLIEIEAVQIKDQNDKGPMKWDGTFMGETLQQKGVVGE
tara:strand:+ start:715 stop:1155 length:441 start_codon:yes stop_codon:yes gene_type:complete